MSFEQFNRVCQGGNLLPTKKIKELSLETDYKVTALRKLVTKYGMKAVATIDNAFDVFLPGRASKMLEQNDALFGELVNLCSENQLSLRYLGGQFNAIEWKK